MGGTFLVASVLAVIWPLGVVVVLVRRGAPVTVADLVTFGRVLLTGALVAAKVYIFSGTLAERTWLVAVLAGTALLLDAVDGQVARRTGTATAAGARFDVEADAALLLVLSMLAAPVVGWWVLAIGLMRYAFVAAWWVRPALRGVLEFNQIRRVIAAVQGVALLIALLPVTPRLVGVVVAGTALLLLVWSFARDIVQLERGARERA